jgi:hypothetical protein
MELIQNIAIEHSKWNSPEQVKNFKYLGCWISSIANENLEEKIIQLIGHYKDITTDK